MTENRKAKLDQLLGQPAYLADLMINAGLSVVVRFGGSKYWWFPFEQK